MSQPDDEFSYSTTPGACRARTKFPWLGVLRTGVHLSGTDVLGGTMVRVESKENGSFTIRSFDNPGLTGSVPADSVDEPLCATIEPLLGRTNIRWGGLNQGGWRLRATASRDFEIPGGEGTLTVRRHDEVSIGRSGSAGTYAVIKDDQIGEVPLSWVSEIRRRPSHQALLSLMCFEFAPYAADLAGLQETFVQTANRYDCFDYNLAGSALTYWARSIGADPPGETVARSGLFAVRLQRGDLVHFYDGDDPVHTAVAAGGGDDVYSLWNMPEYWPVRVSASTLIDIAEKRQDVSLTHIRAAAPKWHRP